MLFPDVFPVTCHTRFVGAGSLFVALKGERLDGVDFIPEALLRGAREFALDRGRIAGFKPLCLCGVASAECSQDVEWRCASCGVVYYFPLSGRRFLAEMSAERLGFPARKLKVVGVTGTKGKTTTTFIAEHIAQSAGKKTALLGTVMARIGNKQCSAEMTTPTADQLHVFFSVCVHEGVDVVFMEVSSHALALEKLHGVDFDVVGFTNFGSDHLDFHRTIEEYFAAKLNIFNHVKSGGVAVLGLQSEWMKKAEAAALRKGIKIFSFGEEGAGASYSYELTQNSFQGVGFELMHNQQPFFKGLVPALFGAFNAANAVMAVLLNYALGVPVEGMSAALSAFVGVPGRLQKHVLRSGAYGFVDYAHNALAVDAVLKELRPLTDHLIVIFGCGGDRKSVV